MTKSGLGCGALGSRIRCSDPAVGSSLEAIFESKFEAVFRDWGMLNAFKRCTYLL